MNRALLSRLGRDRRGATIVEFAVVLPVMLTLIMGLGELTYQGYVQSVLTGAVQKAARDGTIQGNAQNTAALDASVMRMVWSVASNATYTSTRKSYAQYGNVGPEYFYDTAGTGVFDPTKDCFVDVNGNHIWDADPGATGQGGAEDVAVYTVNVTYPHLFPVSGLIGWSKNATLSATTILKNQPYATQVGYTATKICPH